MRKHPLVSAMLMLGMTGNAAALGLGELEVGSALFQPLQARIVLHGWEKISIENLRAALASEQAFLRANIARPFLLRDLRMEVVRSGGDAVILVTSRQPIREPMLEFLVDVEWPGGRLQRQYTVLLDPPVTPTVARARTAPTAPRAASTTAAVAEPPASVTAAPPLPTGTTQAAKAPVDASATPPRATYRVRRNDTLGEIAKQLRPDEGVTLNQTMMALLEANPQAFVDRNINNLRSGSLLQVPSRKEMLARSRSQATAQVRSQYAAWREARAAKLQAQAEPGPTPQGALRLMPTVPEPVAAPRESTAVAEQGLLERELERTRELLYEREAELDTLRSRMAVYEAELEEMKSILREMREMRERELAAAAQPTPAPASVAAIAPPPARAFDITALLAALLVALGGFGLLSFLFRRLRARSRAQAGAGASTAALALELNQELTRPEPIRPASHDTVTEVAPAVGREAAARGTGRHTAVTEMAPRAAQPTPTEVREMVPDDAPTGDRMLIEADVLIQFGFFQRGYDLMTEALRTDPDNNEYRLKLLELTHALGNADELERQAAILREKLRPGQGALWQRACELGRSLCPASALFRDKDRIEIGQAPADRSPDATPTHVPETLGENGEFVNLDELEEGDEDGQEWEFAAPEIDTLDDDQPTREVRAVDGETTTGGAEDAPRSREWLIPDEALQDPYLGEVLADAARAQHEELAATRPWDARPVRDARHEAEGDARDTDQWHTDGAPAGRGIGPDGTHEYPAAPPPATEATGEHATDPAKTAEWSPPKELGPPADDAGENAAARPPNDDTWSPTTEFRRLEPEAGEAPPGDEAPTREWRRGTGLREAIMGNVDSHGAAGDTDEHRAGPGEGTRPYRHDHGTDTPTQQWPHADGAPEQTREWPTAGAGEGHSRDGADDATAPHPVPGGAAPPPHADATAQYPSTDPEDTQEIEPLEDHDPDAAAGGDDARGDNASPPYERRRKH